MSYKNGGLKATWKEPDYGGYPGDTFTVYTGNESVSDVTGYRVVNSEGKVVRSYFEDDLAKGKESLIDVLYYLKHHGIGKYPFGADWQDIVIEDVSRDEIERVMSIGR